MILTLESKQTLKWTITSYDVDDYKIIDLNKKYCDKLERMTFQNICHKYNPIFESIDDCSGFKESW